MSSTPSPGLRYVRAADDVELRYEVVGDGPPVVFLHGGLAGRDCFFRQVPALEPQFRLILRDLRGHNGMPGPLPADYAMDTTEVDDLLAVLDAEGVDRAHIVAHSTGGPIAIAFALAHPERTGRVVLIEPTLVSLAAPDVQAREDVMGARVEAAPTPEEAGYVLIDRVAGVGWRDRVRPAMLEQIDAGAGVIVAQHRALRRYRFDEEAFAAKSPDVFFVFGAQSPELFRSIAAGASARFPSAHFLEVNGGHSCYVQRASEVNAAILAFLGAIIAIPEPPYRKADG